MSLFILEKNSFLFFSSVLATNRNAAAIGKCRSKVFKKQKSSVFKGFHMEKLFIQLMGIYYFLLRQNIY